MVEAVEAPANALDEQESMASLVMARRRRFTVDEYYRMGDAGILGFEERTELIDGEVILMPPIGSGHSSHVMRLNRVLINAVGTRALVNSQNPVRLSQSTEPQPDFLVLRWRDDEYLGAHPGPNDVLLVIEVSDSSLPYDRRVKLPFYAASGIPEAWIVNLRRPSVELYWQPKDGSYLKSTTLERGASITLQALPDVTIQVGDVLIAAAQT